MLNTGATGQIHKDMFLFLGKMMGVAIRTQNNLNLSLPPLFWKHLVCEEITMADLKGIDECCYQLIDIMTNL
jgi:hypothetical protein